MNDMTIERCKRCGRGIDYSDGLYSLPDIGTLCQSCGKAHEVNARADALARLAEGGPQGAKLARVMNAMSKPGWTLAGIKEVARG